MPHNNSESNIPEITIVKVSFRGLKTTLVHLFLNLPTLFNVAVRVLNPHYSAESRRLLFCWILSRVDMCTELGNFKKFMLDYSSINWNCSRRQYLFELHFICRILKYEFSRRAGHWHDLKSQTLLLNESLASLKAKGQWKILKAGLVWLSAERDGGSQGPQSLRAVRFRFR